jgi:hypothetical protein
MENSLEQGVKKFFDKPEGKVGKGFLVLIGLGLLFVLYKALPYILILLTNTLHAMLLLGAILLIIFLVTNKKVQMLFSFGFQMVMRWITGVFVELNPIAIIRIHIENLKHNHSAMDVHIGALGGEIRGLEAKIKDNKQNIEKSLRIASSAKESDQKGQAWIEARKAGRRKDGTIKLTDLLTKLKKIYDVLTKMYEISGFVIEDLEDDVQNRETEYISIKKAHAALMSSMSIIKGNPNERAMFELALEKMEEEISTKLGTMDRFMDMSANLVAGIDIEQGIFAEDGMLMLEEYEKGGFDAFLNDFGKMPSGNNVDENESLKSTGIKPLKKNADGKYF